MTAEIQYDVFLSHNYADKAQVLRLSKRLKAAGIRVGMNQWVTENRDVTALKLYNGLEQSRVLVLCVSSAALASDWMVMERCTAFHRDPSSVGRRFIPLLLDDCEIPNSIRHYEHIDFRKKSDTAFAKLLTACGTNIADLRLVSQTDAGEKSRMKQSYDAAGLERKFRRHLRGVTSMAFSFDGSLMASGSFDKTVAVWITASWETLFWFRDACGEITSLSFSSDGKRLLASSKDTYIYMWDLEGGKLLRKLRGHKTGVNGALSLPKGDQVVSWSGGGENAIMMWEASDDDAGGILSRHQSSVRALAVSEDGKRGLFGQMNGTLQFFHPADWSRMGSVQGHTRPINAVKISRDGRFAFTASDDATVKIWDVRTGRTLGALEGHCGPVLGIALSPVGFTIASISLNEDTVRLWDWRSGKCFALVPLGIDSVALAVDFSPDGSTIAVGLNDGSISIYRVRSRPPATTVDEPRRYLNAKVVLLGEGTVGKTSLAYRLIEDRYVVEDRTHGMKVWRLDLPLPPESALEREVLLWDLAGQEDYRLIHQLFLNETALALLLINPQKEDPFVEAGDWLKALKSANDPKDKHSAACVLVFSQVDVGGMRLSNSKIDLFCQQHGLTSWLWTSAKTGENCSDKESQGKASKLKRLISESIPWDKLPWTSTPRLLAELKKAVMTLRDSSDIRLLRFSELAQRLEQALPGQQFSDKDLRTAVTLLANHGVARQLKFGDLVLLRPDLINGYAGSVIRAARCHRDEIGCVLESDIYRPDFDFTGVDRLKYRPDEELLLRALVQTFLDHSLCIAEHTPQGRHLVFPSQYRREKDIPHEADIFISYTFSGEWQTVWTTLVVRLWYSQEFARRELWRNAAEFESARRQTLGLKITKLANGQAMISLYFDAKVPDELKIIFIEYVHRHLAKFACEVTRDRRYVCPKCNYSVKDLEAVRCRLAAQKSFITCHVCDEKVPLIDFIEQRLRSDPVASRIVAMDETATRELDAQALEQILLGHMMAIAGEANQIFRPLTMFDHGIDGEVEFKDDDGKASGKRIYIQLKSGNSYLRKRKRDGLEVFDVKEDRHLEYWLSQQVDVYLVIRQTDNISRQQVIRWMNVTDYLQRRKNKSSRQIIFEGEKLDMAAVWRLRGKFFPVSNLHP